ncbi:hypothetical protein HY68_35405 [Streptomyces sp. AcH 505]|uniref:hypothetical protein n=1 Tax=Streptomyces sp. AcH 505 TaxID=352211 RepID=UPI000591E687|nr:hypothetical protein HY68_35405 [Streptomyces sp. AcH 505]
MPDFSLSAALPTLVVAVVVFSALAVAGVTPWTVELAVVPAVALQTLVTFIRLGRPGGSSPSERSASGLCLLLR